MTAAAPPQMSEDQEHRVDRIMAFVRNVGILVVVASVGFVIGIAFCLNALGDVHRDLGKLRDVQTAGITRGYRNRAPSCVALLLAPTMRLPDVCTEPEVRPYICAAAAQTNAAWVPRIESQTGAPCTYPAER